MCPSTCLSASLRPVVITSINIDNLVDITSNPTTQESIIIWCLPQQNASSIFLNDLFSCLATVTSDVDRSLTIHRLFVKDYF